MELTFETTGYATLICHDREPILATDPWLEGKARFGSWALSHEVPQLQREAVQAARYLWISQRSSEHLGPVEALAGRQVLLPDHEGNRLAPELRARGAEVFVLPDRGWVQLSERIRVMSIADPDQNAVLLVDLGGVLVVNANTAGDRWWRKAVAGEVALARSSFLLARALPPPSSIRGEDGSVIAPRQHPAAGRSLSQRADRLGVDYVIPFADAFVYARRDSGWGNEWRVRLADHRVGFESARARLLPAFVRWDCERRRCTPIAPAPSVPDEQDPAALGDDWSEPLSRSEADAAARYLRSFELLRRSVDFVNLRVGGLENPVPLRASTACKGVTFELPRGSLLSALACGNFAELIGAGFAKVVLHGLDAGELRRIFERDLGRWGEHAGVHTESDRKRYFASWQARDPVAFALDRLEEGWMLPLERATTELLRGRFGATSNVYLAGREAWRAVRRALP